MADVRMTDQAVAATPAPDASLLGAEVAAGDLLPAIDAARDLPPGCIPLALTPLPEPSAVQCPPSADTPECAAEDQGAVVARTASCLGSWGSVPFQCEGWPTLPDGQEFVVLTLVSCANLARITQALACPDRIAIDYADAVVCDYCWTGRSTWRLFSLPLDPRPIIATATFPPAPPCLTF